MADTKIPGNRNHMISFYETHYPIWEANAALVGLDPLTMTPLKDAVDAAVAAMGTAIATRNASKTATEQLDDKADALRTLGGSYVATIRAFAEFTDNTAVYDIAKISQPAPPVPVGPPTAPTNLAADPTANGTIIVTWKGTTAQGQFFIIERSIDGGAWVRMEPVAAKTWTDFFVPRQSNVIQYQVWGARFDERSPTAPQATVNFGTVDPALVAAFRANTASRAA